MGREREREREREKREREKERKREKEESGEWMSIIIIILKVIKFVEYSVIQCYINPRRMLWKTERSDD